MNKNRVFNLSTILCPTLSVNQNKFDMDETKRLRECEFAEFEINEIEAANLSLGEDDEVENEFKKLSGSEKIMSSLSDAYQIMGYEGNQGVCECISRVGYDLSEI